MSFVNAESASDTELEEDDDTELEEELGARPFMFEPEASDSSSSSDEDSDDDPAAAMRLGNTNWLVHSLKILVL